MPHLTPSNKGELANQNAAYKLIAFQCSVFEMQLILYDKNFFLVDQVINQNRTKNCTTACSALLFIVAKICCSFFM